MPSRTNRSDPSIADPRFDTHKNQLTSRDHWENFLDLVLEHLVSELPLPSCAPDASIILTC